MAVFDLVKNGVACLSNPLEQFFGIKFQERSLAKLSPLRSMRIIVGIGCHSASCNNRLSSTTTKPSLEARRKVRCTFYRRRGPVSLALKKAPGLGGEVKAKLLNCFPWTNPVNA